MKKLFSAFILLLAGTSSYAQTFWTEDFGTGCNRGQAASSYTGTNGPWTITATGTNDAYANSWYVSATCAGTGAGNCSSSCISAGATNASLHVSNIDIIVPSFLTANADTGASYFSGGLCGFGYCAATNRRAESPLINCSGKSNISVSFLYLENGSGTSDDASLCYSADGGTTWTTIDPLAKTTGSCSSAGQWTSLAVTLPASANNNSAVKLGFKWVNNDDGTGTDPSFAVDDIVLSQSSGTGIASYSGPGISLFSKGNGMIQVNENGLAYKIMGIYNVLGEETKFTQTDNILHLEQATPGIYFITLDINGTRVVNKILLD
jgi:hypothetical protein